MDSAPNSANTCATLYSYTVPATYGMLLTKNGSNYTKVDAPLSFTSIIHSVDISISKSDLHLKLNSTRSNLAIESLTFPSKDGFIKQNFHKLSLEFKTLNFNNLNVLDIGFKILQLCALNNIYNISVSKTSNDEILIYRKKKGAFFNILIDNDGDISFMLIGNKIGEQKSKFFPSNENVNLDEIVSLL